jgi:ubiquitin-protein ligase E3 C
VTNENKLNYILLYANYVLNKKASNQAKAFVEGLQTVISKEKLSFFFPDEIQMLITGGLDEIDIGDLMNNTIYHGYTERDPYIVYFWNYLKSLDNEQKEKFLLFVTGSSRPPLLGFKYLNPKFCVHAIHLDSNEQNRLPTSSTCMNMFKLPHYGNFERLKTALDYAINSNSGFGLS